MGISGVGYLRNAESFPGVFVAKDPVQEFRRLQIKLAGIVEEEIAAWPASIERDRMEEFVRIARASYRLGVAE